MWVTRGVTITANAHGKFLCSELIECSPDEEILSLRSHFTDEETKAQGGKAGCPGPQSW